MKNELKEITLAVLTMLVLIAFCIINLFLFNS